MSRPSPAHVLSRYTLTDRLFALWDWLRSLGLLPKKKETAYLRIEQMEDRIVPTAAVWFDPSSQVIQEGATSTVLLHRSGDVSNPLTVNLGIGADGEGDPQAIWSVDYTLTTPGTSSLSATGGTVTFGAGVSELTLTISTADGNMGGTQGLQLTIQSGTGYSPGSVSNGSGISDDVQITPGLPVVWLGTQSQQIIEGNQGGVWVYRDGGNEDQPLTVNLSFGLDGSGDALATWNTDYTVSGPEDGSGSSAALSSTGGTVTFGADQTAVLLTVSTQSHAASNGIEGFRVTLSNSAAYQAGLGAGSSGGGTGSSGGSGGSGSSGGSGGSSGATWNEATSDVQITAGPILSITSSPSTIVPNYNVTFSVVSATSTMPDYTSVEWDFNYGGETFQPSISGTSLSATTSFTATGSRTVAAELTDNLGDVQVVTLPITISNPQPSPFSSIEAGTNPIVTGSPIEFDIASTPDSAGDPVPNYTLVEWDFNYNGLTFQASASGGSLSTTTTFNATGSGTVAARLTDDAGNVTICTMPITVSPPPDDSSTTIEANTSSVAAGDQITFDIATTGTLPPNYSLVEWDFNYGGQNFQPSVSGADYFTTTTFDAAGSQTVAARLTDAEGNVQIITLPITISPPAQGTSTSIVPDTDNILTGESVTFSVGTSGDVTPNYTSAAWDFNYDGQNFQPSVSGTNLFATTTFNASGTQTIAAQLTDDAGNVQIVTLTVTVSDPPQDTMTWIESEASDIVPNYPVTFDIGTDVDPAPSYTSVEWDFNYNGQNFVPSVTGDDLSTSTTFAATGSQTVAAELTDSSGNVQIITLPITISAPQQNTTSSIEASMSPVVTGAPVTFSITNNDGSTVDYGLVEWDFDYDGQNFEESASSDDLSTTMWFNTTGSQTVAARLTDDSGNVTICTMPITISAPPAGTPLSVQAETGSITTGTAATFAINTGSNSAASYALVEWDFNYDGQNFQPSESGTALSATTTFDTAGSQTVAARLTDDAGNTQIVTFNATISSPTQTPYIEAENYVESENGDIANDNAATFSIAGPATDYTSVEWDFNYNGQNFQPSESGTGLSATTTFNSDGNQTIAAQLTDESGNVQIVTLSVTIADPPPELTIPDNMTVNVGRPVTLSATATAESGIASVQWSMSFDNGDFEPVDLATLNPAYTFPTFGEYQVLVQVTANDGQVIASEFLVTAQEVAPTEAVTVSGPINEGQAETFTVNTVDPDQLDSTNIYADWKGTGDFVEVDPSTWTINPNGSVSFSHVYDLNTALQNNYAAVIRVEDDGGQDTNTTVHVVVNDVIPQATLTAGYQIATIPSSNQNVWVIQSGQEVQFDSIAVPTQADLNALTYHIVIDGQDTQNSSASLPQNDGGYTPDTIYQVQGWVTDHAGQDSTHQTFTVVVYNSVNEGGASSPIYAETYIKQDGRPDSYGYYDQRPSVTHPGDWPVNTPLTVVVKPDQPTVQFASQQGATIAYQFTVTITDSDGDLVSQKTYRQQSSTFTVPGQPKNRSITVGSSVSFVKNGQTTALTTQGEMVYAHTPFTRSVVQQASDLLQAIQQLTQEFGDRATALWNAIKSNPTQFFNTLAGGLEGALKQFFAELPNSLGGQLFSWLLGPNSSVLTAFQGLNLSTLSSNDLLSLGLQYAGLTWDHIYSVIQQRLGAGNLAALDAVSQWFNGVNASQPAGVANFFDNLSKQDLEGLTSSLSISSLTNELIDVVKTKAGQALAEAMPQLIAKFLPWTGALSSLASTLGWLANNSQQLGSIFTTLLSDASLNALKNGSTSIAQSYILKALNNAVPVFLSFAANQLGLGRLPQQIQQAVAFIPAQVDKALRSAVDALASKVKVAIGGGTQGGSGDQKMAPERVFNYQINNQNNTYMLWVTNSSQGFKVKLAQQTSGGYTLLADLTAKSFDDSVVPPGAQKPSAHLNALITAASNLQSAAKSSQKPSAATISNLKALQQALTAAEDKVVADIKANACKVLNAGCFAAGTKLMTKAGWRAVETIEVGDWVLSRDEFDPSAAADWKQVEEKFQRTGRVLHLHIAGEVIRTTPEHPFFVERKGWIAAGALQEGDRVATLTSGWAIVEEIYDTELYEAVYNLRVADWHTYFVGDDAWGFSVWAHNAYVVKGGLGHAWKLDPVDVTITITLDGTSVWTSPTLSYEELARLCIANTQYRYTTTQAILAVGGRLWYTPQYATNTTIAQYHYTVTNLTIEKLNALFGPAQTTPS